MANDDWFAIEHVIEVLNGIRKRLKAGAQGPGAIFDADECAKILGALANANPAYPNSRPPADMVKEYSVYVFYVKLKQSGMPSKTAIASTAEHFGCSISTVRAVLKTYK